MSPAHLTAVGTIERDSFPTPRSNDLYRRELTQNDLAHYWVITPQRWTADRPAVVAYGGYWLMGDEAHVVVIATHRAWRRQGLGTWLMVEMAAAARTQGALQLTLEVREQNQSARAFYAGLGFSEIGVRRGYYTDTGEDAHLLTLCGLETDPVWQPLNIQLYHVRRHFMGVDNSDSL